MSSSQPTMAEAPAEASRWERWTDAHGDLIAVVIILLGLALRLREAWGTFLNPDEALHFFLANHASLAAAYKASLTQAHPPLLVFMLYGLRPFGSSEFILRLPSILTGTLFCWIFFQWLSRILGRTVGIVGLVFVALLSPMISVTAQVRQYGLLLVFAMSALWFLERALDENSSKLMIFSAISLWLAMLSHYSALLFVVVIGVYALLRIWTGRVTIATRLAGLAGQAVAFALAVFLYRTHISKIKGTTMAEQAFDGWLRKSYFHHGHDNPITFLATRTFSFFQYAFGQLVVGDVVALLFFAGLVFLLRGKVTTRKIRWLTALVIMPFALNYALALLDLYPYGGTRHCLYLAIFAIPVVSVCVVRIAGQRTLRALAIAVLIAALCFIFRTNHAPYIARADQNIAHMRNAIRFVNEQIPASDPILVDYESGMELGHYLCNQKPVTYDLGTPGLLVFHCADHRIISTIPDVWAFTPPVFLQQWTSLTRSGFLQPGKDVWVLQAGWMVKLDEKLRTIPEFRDVKTEKFGNNIRFFKLNAGQPIPPSIPDSEALSD